MDSDAAITLSAAKFVSGDSTNICRLCFASIEGQDQEYCVEDSVRLVRPYFNESVSFVDMFNELCVTMESLLPSVICTECAAATINSYLFQKLCQYSSRKWKEALSRLDSALSQLEYINPNIQTTYTIINEDDNITFTSKKRNIAKNKVSTLHKIRSIMASKTKYVKKKHEKINVMCEECGEHCYSNISLIKHRKSHNKSHIPCPQCAKYFASQVQLNEHAERVHYPKTIQCSQCAKMFSTERMLKRHEKTHHIAAICKLCFVQFPSKNALRAHLDKHDVNLCLRCSKSFLNKQTYKLHLKICGNPDTKQSSFFCDICNKGYARKNSLRTHLKTDHGFGRVLSCTWCNKKFDAISRLRNHIVKHTKEKNFYCEHCGGKFVTQAALVYHIRLHTGEKPFACDLCDEKFLSASRRMEHKWRKHFEPTKECPVCHVKFVTGHQLRSHVKRHNNPHSKLYVPNSKEDVAISEKSADLDPFNIGVV